MTTLTVIARGQVRFRKDVLQHLGIRPGERIELDKLPGGRVMLRAGRPSGTIDGFRGCSRQDQEDRDHRRDQ